ncbi:MAG: T9SS type A sorting domain-containing protein [Bacteroidetes bacterium]|nr:T9SS type A sorting domain-containing protein [Bacteroidota bacterium]
MKNLIRSIALILLLASFSKPALSQWTQRQNLPGTVRTFATGFSINNTIYVMGGYDGSLLYNDVWAYDPTLDTWTQKGDFPGGNRSACTAFTIGNKAYMGTGNDGNDYLKDFWEYEPVSDTWTQLADFPGFEREEAVSFCIGNKGYVGTGQTFVVTPNGSFTTTYDDLYEYAPALNIWTQKASLPGPTRAYAVASVIGNKGYIGLGGNDDQSASYTDFYEYDPGNDSWTAITSMGGSGRAEAGVFSDGNNMYVIGGINFPSFVGVPGCRVYDATTNSWAIGPAFNPGIIIAPVIQKASGRVFAGTGYYGSIVPRKDWWEFTSLPTAVSIVEQDVWNVYPNPFSNELVLNLQSGTENRLIEIVDVNGKIVYKLALKNSLSDAVKINTSDFSDGIYFLLIKNQSGGVMQSKKVIKN